jgi:hypothetical protein
MRRYMEYKKIYRLYTVSQIVTVTTTLDCFGDQPYVRCWRLAVDDNDFVVPAQRTIDLQKLFNLARIRNNQGK